jgi:hypothetical protein
VAVTLAAPQNYTKKDDSDFLKKVVADIDDGRRYRGNTDGTSTVPRLRRCTVEQVGRRAPAPRTCFRASRRLPHSSHYFSSIFLRLFGVRSSLQQNHFRPSRNQAKFQSHLLNREPAASWRAASWPRSWTNFILL